jgi:hypothetical protein
MHRLYCPVATADGRIIETGVGVGNDLIDMSRQNGSIIINIEYYLDVESVKNELKGIRGKSPLHKVVHEQANITQTVCYITQSQVELSIYLANKRLTQFLEEIWGFWNVQDVDLGLYDTKILTENDNSIVLPNGFYFTGIRVKNEDGTWIDVEVSERQTTYELPVTVPTTVMFKADMG